MQGDEAYVLSKALTASIAAGVKNYTISDTGLLEFDTSDGKHLTYQFIEPEDGVSVTGVSVNSSNHLIVTYSDETSDDAGIVPTVKGDDGRSVNSIKINDKEHLIITYSDGTTEDAGKISGGGSGGSAELTAKLTAAIAVGGISSGTSYEEGTPLETLLRDMLEPTLYPTFTAPSASLSYSASTYYKVGGSVSAAKATISYNAGAITLNGTKQNNRGGAVTGYAVSTNGADTEYSESNTESGIFNVPTLSRASKGTIVITGTASYDEGPQPKDSKGNDYSTPLAAGSVSASKTLTFIQPYYYGASDTSSISDFTDLTENVTSKGNKTFNFTTDDQHMVFAYDKSYGVIKNIIDGNGFDVTSGWSSSTLTVDGFEYYVYVADSATTDTNAPFTFKY